MDNVRDTHHPLSLAIIGMAGRFPGARNVGEFWQNLVSGARSTRFFSDEELLAAGVAPDLLQNPQYVKAGTVLEDFDRFDASFFGFTPREAEIMDPQSRLLLQCAWEALGDAGYEPGAFDVPVGIFAGKRFPWYMIYNLGSNPDVIDTVGSLQVGLSNQNDSLASLIAYKLDLKGPAVNVQTYCSTSLVAVHLACQSLLAYECDAALAGGAAVQIPHGRGYLYQEGGISSPDGYCRTFDADGKGSIFGDGLALVVLKRLEEALADGDHIYAVIRGSALNNDGVRRVGYTAPGLNGQAAVIAEALGSANVTAESISYIEAHGAGTPLGDSVELEAMNRAFRRSTERTQFCAIGSVKPNVGHLDRAAGVTGLIKTALALKHHQLPPTLNFERPNSDFDWDASPFYVNTELRPWQPHGSRPRRAGVSSFGLGGTNVHVVLEEAPAVGTAPSSRLHHLLLLSAKTEQALAQRTADLADHLRAHPDQDLADVAYTLQVGRAAFAHRRIVLCEDSHSAVTVLETADSSDDFSAHRVQPERPVNFVFPGVEAYTPGMECALYQTEPIFREWMDRACELLITQVGLDLRPYLFSSEVMERNDLQPQPAASVALFVVEYALAQLLQSWGIRPQAVIGDGPGNYVAACLAGVMSLPDALMLVAAQASLIDSFNTDTISLHPPQIPLVSSVTGTWLTAEAATDPAYWTQPNSPAEHLEDGLATLLAQVNVGTLIVGPDLSSPVRRHPACGAKQRELVWSMLPRESDAAESATTGYLLQTLGKMWLAGVEIDWAGFYQHEQRQRVPLPAYPFAGERYWVDAVQTAADGHMSSSPTQQGKKPDIGDWFYRPVWQQTPAPTMAAPTTGADDWLVFCDGTGLGEQLAQQCRGTAVCVHPGDGFSRREDGSFIIRADAPASYTALWRALRQAGKIPDKIVHLWSVGSVEKGAEAFTAAQASGFYSLIYLVQALSQENGQQPLSIAVVTGNAQPVAAGERLHPEKTAVFGVCRAIVQECSHLTCHAVDVDLDDGHLPDLAAHLTAELAAPATDLEVAYRRGERYTRTYQPQHLAANQASLLRQQGVCLITGGMGGVGQVLAEHLARTYQARLVLTGRSPLPKREAWSDWLESHPENDDTSRKIRRVRALEALGAEVMVVAADVADETQMAAAWEAAVNRFGPIHGVIHAAGISDLQSFQSVELITSEQCERHFRPKVHGLYVLNALVSQYHPDFCLLFSSLSSVLGGLGFVAYTAANIFMDAFAWQQNRQAHTRWLSVNWDTWRVRANRNEIVGKTVAEFEMTPEEGVAAFERVLAHEIGPQVIHSTGDLASRLRQWIQPDNQKGTANETTRLAGTGSHPNLTAAEVERQITAVWQDLLGIDEIGIYDNFFDLGGNSLIGMTLIARLKDLFGAPIPITALFEAPTISALARYLRPEQEAKGEATQTAVLAERRRTARRATETQSIAIIGMAGRFPGAPNLETFWRNLRDGVESVTRFTTEELIDAGVPAAEVNHPDYVKARPIIEDADLFDAPFFGFNPREAELTDPQHRLFLECAWEAMETAGYDPRSYPGLVGVFGGMGLSFYLLGMAQDTEFLRSLGAYEASYQLAVGNDKDSLTTAVSYKLDLKGPSLSVQTFCSTSLVAVHLGCQSLLGGECDMALAGGVSVRVPIKSGYMATEGGMESPDGHCRTFDARAAGTMFGDGVGIVLLKRLEDAIADGDTIYACIKGSAVNNDGSLKVGYAAPSVEGQAEVIATALETAGVTADTIDYIEAHGTATPLGDPIEVAALTKAFRRTTGATRYCALGSVKTNIGHVDRAAGVSGLIKTVLALQHEQIPPSLHFEQPNPEIDFEDSPFTVNTSLTPWRRNGRPRRAGVSSLGMGGTNAHVVLEEAPSRKASDPGRPWQLMLLSARTEAALAQATTNLADHLRQYPALDLADAAYTLQVGRTRLNHRRAILFSDRDDLLSRLEPTADNAPGVFTHYAERDERPVAFMLSGVGDQYANMAESLYHHEPDFRETVDRCLTYLATQEGLDLKEVLYPPKARSTVAQNGTNGQGPDLRRLLSGATSTDSLGALGETAAAQPAVFVIEYALARLLMGWGIRPQALIGYSLGEYVAACLAGVFSLEDALTLVTRRAQLIQELPQGAMLAVSLPVETVESYLSDDLAIAAVNGPRLSVVTGTNTAVAALETELATQDVACRRLPTTHAFHSPLMAPIAADLADLLRTFALNPPRIPCLSNVTGDWITAGQATNPDYWVEHLLQPVRFTDGLAELLRDPDQILLEVGPGNTLTSLAKLHPDCTAEQNPQILSTLPAAHTHRPAAPFLLETLGKLWLSGVAVDWSGYYRRERRHRLPLPTYPFQRQRYWRRVSSPSVPGPSTNGTAPSAIDDPIETLLNQEPPKVTDLADWGYVASWKRTLPPSPSEEFISGRQNWLIFADACGLADKLVTRLRACEHQVTVVRSGSQFKYLGQNEYMIRAKQTTDYQKLVQALHRQGQLPHKIAHLWSVTATAESLESVLDRGFYSLLFLAQGLGNLSSEPCQWAIISSDMQDVTTTARLRSAKATVLGPYKVIPQELAHMRTCSIDISLPAPGSRQEAELVEQLWCELTAEFSHDVIALRGTSRWVQQFEPASIPAANEQAQLLRPEGVYLITGGLGGIGLALAEYLVTEFQARVVLLGRSGLPPRHEWETILARDGKENGLGYKIHRLQTLEAMDGEVLVVEADVTNRGQMETAVSQAIQHFGAIHGVFHMAGVPPLGLILLKEAERAAAVLAPKVQGTLVLQETLREIDLDFTLLFSSISAVTGGGPGQVDYCAANAFMDAFARYEDGRNGRVLSVGWGEWLWDSWQAGLEGFDPGARAYFQARRKRFGIAFNEGFELIRRLLCRRLSHVVISTQDFQQVADGFSKEMLLEQRQQQGENPKYPRPSVGVPYIAPRNELESQIAVMWSDLLGIEEVGMQDNFFELGGNSLIGVDLVTRLRRELNQATIPLNLLYEAPTIGQMAGRLQTNQQEEDSAEQRLTRGQLRRQRAMKRRRS